MPDFLQEAKGHIERGWVQTEEAATMADAQLATACALVALADIANNVVDGQNRLIQLLVRIIDGKDKGELCPSKD